MSSPPPALLDAMRSLLTHGEFSDMEIHCGGTTFKTHRAVVCMQSHFFHSALSDGFKETVSQAVSLPEDDPETIKRVLHFLYLQDYDELEDTVPSGQATEDISKPKCDNHTQIKAAADMTIQVYIAADKFGILPLKTLAADKFSEWAASNWQSPVFAEVVADVMTLIPPHDTGLRDIVARTIAENTYQLMRQDEILRLLERFGGLGMSVLATLASRGMVKLANEMELGVLSSMAEKLTNSPECWLCQTKFNVLMKSGEYEMGTFRCLHCKEQQ
ncbi:hypothetical protein ASPZODRAFT_125791, partial [Penicilliopsis zonata CBS 506.65]